MRAAGYTDVERGERGSTEEHLTVTQFKVQAEQQRLEAVTAQVAQAEQILSDAQSQTEKQEKKLKALQKETKVAQGVALSVQDIEDMGKPQKFSGNIVLTPSECETLKAHAINSMVLRAENTKLKEQLKTTQKSAAYWKKQFDDLKEKAQPYLDALEIAAERVRAFLFTILARGKETQEHKQPARRKQQDMEL